MLRKKLKGIWEELNHKLWEFRHELIRHHTLVIRLPWKRKSHDDNWYWTKLIIRYDDYKLDKAIEASERWIHESHEKIYNIKHEKRKKSGLPKCPGHKKRTANYNEDNKCSICGKFKIPTKTL